MGTSFVHDAEIVMGHGGSIVSRLSKPRHGNHFVLVDAVTERVQAPEINLSLEVAFVRRAPPLALRGGVIALRVGLVGGNL